MTYRRPDRREFIRLVAVTSTAAGLSLPIIGCGDGDTKTPVTPDMGTPDMEMPSVPLDPAVVYPQGLASGDPKPDSVILWTRVEPGEEMELAVDYEVAIDENFEMLVASGQVTTNADSDHVVRIKVLELSPHTTYYYRFSGRGTTSIVGRTRTAPSPDQDVSVRYAIASCQDYNGRQYYAWRALAEEPDVDFVLFLGDYIYETSRDPGFQEQTGRHVTIPDGLALNDDGSSRAALTLADYRSLYRQYRSDPDLQAMHARAPFICVWDDHEFADDSWQDHSTHFDDARGDEKDNARRTAASRAWYEYQPADVSYNQGQNFPADLQIYRTLRFGQHCEIFMTDLRSYRADHLIPEGPENPMVGKFSANSALGARNFLLKSGFDAIEREGPVSMLGAEQKQWLIDGIRGSNATWKVWGSQVQAAEMLIDLSSFEMLPEAYRGVFYFSADQWDGYRTERAEVYGALAEVENLVAMAGDIHAFYASELQLDFDSPAEPTAVEYVVAGISSAPVQLLTQRTVEGDELLTALGLADLVPRFDELLQSASPHYRHTSSNENGVGVVDVTAEAMTVTFLGISDPTADAFDGQVNRVQLRTPAGSNRIERV